MRSTSEDTARCRFFAPVERALRVANSTRSCPEFPDEAHIESGLGRVIAQAQSGRDWVQNLRMWMNSRMSVSNFFKFLKSVRRLALLEEVSAFVRAELAAQTSPIQDPLSQHEELKGFAVYASDGHYEAASARLFPASAKRNGNQHGRGRLRALPITPPLAIQTIPQPAVQGRLAQMACPFSWPFFVAFSCCSDAELCRYGSGHALHV